MEVSPRTKSLKTLNSQKAGVEKQGGECLIKVMFWIFAVLVLAGASVHAQTSTNTFAKGTEYEFQIDFVEIGNPGNSPDSTGLGSVSYIYKLGKYEISRDQISKANAVGNLGITMYDMSSLGGNGINRPATGINWNEAARFVNWLNTSMGYHVAYNFTTSGVNDNITLWTNGQSGYNPDNPYRNSNAFYFLPSVDEWYKGGYFDPNKAGGAGYWSYATGSDSAPTAVSGGSLPNTAIYNQSFFQGPADVKDAGGMSPYGIMGQAGNAEEWKESAGDGINNLADEGRAIRGGDWWRGADRLVKNWSTDGEPGNLDYNYLNLGFRVASVPEPSSLSLLLAGGAVLAAAKRRRLV